LHCETENLADYGSEMINGLHQSYLRGKCSQVLSFKPD